MGCSALVVGLTYICGVENDGCVVASTVDGSVAVSDEVELAFKRSNVHAHARIYGLGWKLGMRASARGMTHGRI